MSVELLFYCPNTGRHLVQWRQEPGSVIVMDCPGPERRRDQSRPSDLCLGSLASHIHLLQWTRKHISCITRKHLLAFWLCCAKAGPFWWNLALIIKAKQSCSSGAQILLSSKQFTSFIQPIYFKEKSWIFSRACTGSFIILWFNAGALKNCT